MRFITCNSTHFSSYDHQLSPRCLCSLLANIVVRFQLETLETFDFTLKMSYGGKGTGALLPHAYEYWLLIQPSKSIKFLITL